MFISLNNYPGQTGWLAALAPWPPGSLDRPPGLAPWLAPWPLRIRPRPRLKAVIAASGFVIASDRPPATVVEPRPTVSEEDAGLPRRGPEHLVQNTRQTPHDDPRTFWCLARIFIHVGEQPTRLAPAPHHNRRVCSRAGGRARNAISLRSSVALSWAILP